MTIDEAIDTLLDTRSYGTADIAKSVAINTMRKYQKIQEIYEKWNGVNDFSYKNAMEKIGETGLKVRNEMTLTLIEAIFILVCAFFIGMLIGAIMGMWYMLRATIEALDECIEGNDVYKKRS